MRKLKHEVTKFYLDHPEYEGFYVEVVPFRDKGEVEFYLCREGYGIKIHLMTETAIQYGGSESLYKEVIWENAIQNYIDDEYLEDMIDEYFF